MINAKQLETLNHADTVVIIPATGPEHELAKMFLQNNAPKVIADERMFEELNLLALHGKIKVVVVHRSRAKPAMRYFKQADGMTASELRPEKELMDEMLLSDAVEPKFLRDGPMKPLLLSVPTFLKELGEALAPMGTRMDYIDKGEVKPQILRVSWS